MATFEERAEQLKKELEKAANGNQRRNLSREYELTLRLLRIIRGEVFTLDDINKCRMEIMRQHPGYDRPMFLALLLYHFIIALSENTGSNTHQSRSLFHCHLVISGHTHRKHIHAYIINVFLFDVNCQFF